MPSPAPMTLSPLRVWLLATRPRTLPAAVAPVAVGSALAFAAAQFRFGPAVAALIGALLLQIGVNLANDYFDFRAGIDTPDRLGPLRVTQSGLLAPESVKRGMIATFCLAGVVCLYLIAVAGWPVMLVGVFAILSALAYSGGPYPLASHGLADFFVFLFFGLVAVGGTFYVQTLQLNAQVFWAATPVGLLITAILVVNNLRDIATDGCSGKQTLAVRLGPQGARLEYALLVAAAYAVPAAGWLAGETPFWGLLCFLSFPRALGLIRRIASARGAALNPVLAATANLALGFSLLLALGLILAA
ncbi:MAG: 1,4-dihydroxy-2-naphthoate polyprenyltransferase [Desulfobacterales bacterium]